MADEARAQMQGVLDALGLTTDPEMAETADRFTTFLADLAERTPTPDLSFAASRTPGQAIALRDIPFHSLCAHHLLPFFGKVHVVYRAEDTLAGFGAVPRVVRWAARKPQVQERMAEQILEVLVEGLMPRGALVRIEARHMCVEMRGAETPAHVVVEATAGNVDGLRALL